MCCFFVCFISCHHLVFYILLNIHKVYGSAVSEALKRTEDSHATNVTNPPGTLTPANPPNTGEFQPWRVTQPLPLATLAG